MPVYAPSGDNTGATDAAAINGYLAAGDAVQLEQGTYYVNATLAVSVNNSSLVGVGQSTAIYGVGLSSTTPVVKGSARAILVGEFQITGTGGNALNCNGMTNGSRIFDITVPGGGSWVDVFWFGNCDNCYFDNLTVLLGSTTTSFHIDGNVNACTFNNCGTLNATCTYNFYCEDAGSYGTSSGNVFNAPCAQGGNTGFYIGKNYYDNTINSLYVEDTVFPMVIGNSSTGYGPIGLTVNSPFLLTPGPGQTNYSQRTALIDIIAVYGLTINSPSFVGSVGLAQLVALSFSGGTFTRAAQAYARVNPSTGGISTVIVLDSGAYSSGTPSVTATSGGSGTGSGATFSVTMSGGGVSSVAVTMAGSNYNTGSFSASVPPIRFKNAVKCVVNGNGFSMSGTGTQQFLQCMWPWIVRQSSAPATSGITVIGDLPPYPGTTFSAATANLLIAGPGGTANQHYLQYLNSAGALQSLSYVPPTFP